MATNRNNFFGLGIVPSSSTTNTLPGDLEYLTTDGKLHLRGASANDSIVMEALAQTLSNKTLATPVIATILNTGTLTLPISTDTLVGRATTDTLTNKSISGATNTLTAIPNSALTNSSITVNGSSVSLGGSVTVSATATNALTISTGLSGTSYNGSTAVTIAIDSTVATLTGAQTLTNKTLTTPTLNSPVIHTATADSISPIASTLILGGIVQLGNLQVSGSTLSDVSGGVIVTSSNLTNGITLNALGGSNAIQLQNASTTLLRVNTASIDLPAQTPLKLFDSTNANSVSLRGPTTGLATYTVSLPAAAPTTGTGLVFDGTNYVWSNVGSGGGGSSNITVDTFTGDGISTAFTISQAPTNKNYIFVNINGVEQLKSAYTLSGAIVTMSEAPPSQSTIEFTTAATLVVNVLASGSVTPASLSTDTTNLITNSSKRNFITNGTALASSVAGYSLYVDTAGTAPVSGSGTGTNTITFSASTSSPLTGDASFILSKPASNAQGQGVAYAFNIDNASRAKVVTINFDYMIQSGTFVAGGNGALSDVLVYIYDVTNSQLIQPAGYVLTSSSSTVPYQFSGTFQTSSNSTSYRLLFHVSSTSTTAYAVQMDNISVSPQTTAVGCPVTDWATYNLVIGATTTAPTLGTNTSSAKWRRVGDSMEIMYTVAQTAAGTSGSGTYLFPLPNSYSLDTTKASVSTTGTGSGGTVLGTGRVANTTTTNTQSVSPGLVYAYNPTNLSLSVLNGSVIAETDIVGSTNYAAGNANLFLSFCATVPILGWSSNVQMSSDTDTRVVSTSVGLNTAQAIAANGIVKYDTIVKDTAGSYSTTTGLLTVSVPGSYQISVAASANLSGYQYVKVNGVSKGYILLCPAASQLFSGSITLPLNAGDAVGIYSDAAYTLNGTATNGFVTYAAFTRISGPATIAASEKVYAQYTGNASQSLTANVTDIPFGTKVVDSHGAWSGSSFKAPRPSWYNFTGLIQISTGSGSTETDLYVNGTKILVINFPQGNTNLYPFSGGIYLNAGDVLSFKLSLAATLAGSNTYHYISITSQG